MSIALNKPLARARFGFNLLLDAIASASYPQEYIARPGNKIALLRQAIHEAQAPRAWHATKGQLTDHERIEIALLDNRARFCPISVRGNAEFNKLLSDAGCIRDRGHRRALGLPELVS